MPSRLVAPTPHDRPTGDRISVAAEMLAEFGGAVCPSLSSALERLIDRQATGRAGGVR